jgi:polyisoprenoid-binding protein YceI
MKRLAASVIAASLPLAAAAAPESYTIDPYHTYPQFEVDHLGYSKMRGRFDGTTGKFTIDRQAKTATLEVSVPTKTITTGDEVRGNRPRSRDEHLRTPDFLNVAEFPAMTYKSTKVTFKGEDPATIEGQLTLVGVTKPVTLRVEHWKCGPDPRTKGQRQMCGANATGTLKLTDFGIKFGVPTFIGDELKLWIGIEAYKD